MTEPPTHIEDEQRQVAELLRSFDAPAPASLHESVESLIATRRAPTWRDRLLARRASDRRSRSLPVGLVAASAAGVAAVAIAIGVGLGGGGSTAPSLRQAAAPTLRAATLPAPPESGANHTQLAAEVDGVKFPYWGERFGWRGTGTRSDRIDGRTVTTVFYADARGRRIGYAILAGTPAPRIDGGVVTWRGGVPYRLLIENGASAVTWLRDGHLCVVSGHGVSGATLLRLASWSDPGATVS
ncbi:MAG TPA: hypothetical protein VFC30_07465 [Solirubrobacteraceae bacterium]|nr:hypothetical protein [Solirubrobacteraceae bacterium]